jgi:hypothetical protein
MPPTPSTTQHCTRPSLRSSCSTSAGPPHASPASPWSAPPLTPYARPHRGTGRSHRRRFRHDLPAADRVRRAPLPRGPHGRAGRPARDTPPDRAAPPPRLPHPHGPEGGGGARRCARRGGPRAGRAPPRVSGRARCELQGGPRAWAGEPVRAFGRARTGEENAGLAHLGTFLSVANMAGTDGLHRAPRTRSSRSATPRQCGSTFRTRSLWRSRTRRMSSRARTRRRSSMRSTRSSGMREAVLD